MGFGEAISSGFRNYVNFSDRASRSEYWYWALFATLLTLPARIIDMVIVAGGGFSPVGAIVALAIILPGIAVSVRRLHDLDRTGWWLLLCLTGVGAIVLLVWDCMKGSDGPNRFG